MYEVIDQDSKLLAVKCINLDTAEQSTIDSYKNEIELLKRLQHSTKVIKLYDLYVFSVNLREKSIIWSLI